MNQDKQLREALELLNCVNTIGCTDIDSGRIVQARTKLCAALTATQQAAPSQGAESVTFSNLYAEIDSLKKSRDELLTFANMVKRHQKEEPDVWYWQNDGLDHLESMVSSLPVVIRADHLRALIKADDMADGYAKALEIRTAQGWKLTGEAIPVLYTDSINGQQVMRDDVWLCTTAALRKEDDKAGGEVTFARAYRRLSEVAEARKEWPDQDPVWLWKFVFDDLDFSNAAELELVTLYTRPQQQADQPAERVALSNEQVTKVRQWLWANHAVSFTNDTVKKIFEVGHGITAKDQS